MPIFRRISYANVTATLALVLDDERRGAAHGPLGRASALLASTRTNLNGALLGRAVCTVRSESSAWSAARSPGAHYGPLSSRAQAHGWNSAFARG
jgi:hypothetical protein